MPRPGAVRGAQRPLPPDKRSGAGQARYGRQRTHGFRYDVLLQAAALTTTADDATTTTTLDWQAQLTTLQEVQQRLHDERPARLLLRRLPDARTAAARLALQAMQAGQGTAATLRGAAGRDGRRRGSRGAVRAGRARGLRSELPHARCARAIRRAAGARQHRAPVWTSRRCRLNLGACTPTTRCRASSRASCCLRCASTWRSACLSICARRCTSCCRRIPLTPNGKVDRRALPDPDDPSLQPPTAYHAPSTLAEQRLADIWAAVLGLRARRHPRQLLRARRRLDPEHPDRRPGQRRAACVHAKQLFEHQTMAELGTWWPATASRTPNRRPCRRRPLRRCSTGARPRLAMSDALQPGSAARAASRDVGQRAGPCGTAAAVAPRRPARAASCRRQSAAPAS